MSGQDAHSSWGTAGGFIHPRAPAGGTGPGFSRPAAPGLGGARANPDLWSDTIQVTIGWITLSAPRPVVARRVGAVIAAIERSTGPVPELLAQKAGLAVEEVVHSIVPGLVAVAGVLATTTAAGAGIGAVAGGVGAAPGAAAGFGAGVTLLQLIGLGFLGAAIVDGVRRIGGELERATFVAWHAIDVRGDPAREVDRATAIYAQAWAELGLVILQAVVAVLVTRGIGQLPTLVRSFRQSRYFSALGAWLDANARRLMNNPRLNRALRREGTGVGEPGGGSAGGAGGRGGTAAGGGGRSGGGGGSPREPSPARSGHSPSRTPAQLEALARDPAHGGAVTPKSIQERDVALGLENRGDVRAPIVRSPSPEADFIDGAGQPWDVKGFNSNFPPRQGGFSAMRDAAKVDASLARGENVMLDTTKMSAADIAALRAEGAARSWGDRVAWWP